MNDTGILGRYAKALIGASEERGVLDSVQKDLQVLQDLIRDSEDFREFLNDPLIRPERKQDVFQISFSEKFQHLTMGFLSLLCEKRREQVLEDIIQSFKDFLDDRQGIARVQVRSAIALAPLQRDHLIERLSAFSGKQVRLEVEIDQSLKTGFIARLGDYLIDGTLESQLHLLRRQMLAQR